MARKARLLSEINSYTIMLKADETLQFNSHDKQLFLETVQKYSPVLNYKFLAYNLTDNILSFVLYNCQTQLETTMRKIVISFVSKFNLYHNRTGKVFKDRFTSFPANTVNDVWDMVYNVHDLAKTDFNSANDYFNDKYINTECAKQYFDSVENLNNIFKNNKNIEPLKTMVAKSKIKDAELINFITHEIMPIEELQNLEQSKLKKLLLKIIKTTSASARQIARVTSLPLRMLWKLTRKQDNSEEN